MPQEYSRGRGRINRNYNEGGRGGYTHYASNGGSFRYLRIGLIAGIAILTVVITVLVINMLRSTASGGQGQQTDPPIATNSPEPTQTVEATETPPDASPSPSVSPSISPEASVSASASADPTGTPEPTSTTSSGEDNKEELTVPDIEGKANVTETLSLRKSASATAEVITKINKDETFTILEVSASKTWLKVKYSDNTGYVLAKYVSIGSGGDGKVCTITSTTVNVRSGAGKSHNIVGTLKKGDTVIVESVESTSDGTWCKVSVGSTVGYIDKSLCRLMTTGS